MTILLHTTKRCNFKCLHCFEPETHRVPEEDNLNFDNIRKSLEILFSQPEWQNDHVGLHGGEPTLVPINTLEQFVILAQEYNDRGNHKTGIVTNASKINSRMIELFRRYQMRVSISVDGPENLNILRGPEPNNSQVTTRYNKDLMKSLGELRRYNIPTSIMCVINTVNAGSPEVLTELIDWLDMLVAMGITGGRINPLESKKPQIDKYELTNEQLLYAYKTLFDWNCSKGYRYLPFREFVDNLLGYGNSPCIFGECNWYRTNTVSILPDGTITNCDRTFGEGEHTRSLLLREPRIRTQALRQTECGKCKYWNVCYGGCPSEAIDHDWRNKTKFCEAYYGMYKYVEDTLRGLFPNIQLKIDKDYHDPFFKMSYAYNVKCSSWGEWKPRPVEGQLTTGKIGELVPKSALPKDLDPNLPWTYAIGGYHADSVNEV